MNAIMNNSKTYSSHYLDCVNCHKPIILHWYMRHANKCIDPADRKKFSEAAQLFHSVASGDDNKTQTPVIPIVHPATDEKIYDKSTLTSALHISRASAARYTILLQHSGYEFPDRIGLPGGGKGYRQRDMQAMKELLELHALGKSFEEAAKEVVDMYQPPAAPPEAKPEPVIAAQETAAAAEQPKVETMMVGTGFSTENIKKVLEGTPDPIDVKATQPTEEAKKMLDSFHQVGVLPPVDNFPKFKEWVECTVERIEDFGVIVSVQWAGTDFVKGLIHRTQVRDGKTNSIELNRFFRVGDRVRAQVVDLSKRKINKLGLTTKQSVLPDYYDYNKEEAPGTVVHQEAMPSALAEAMAKNKERLEELNIKNSMSEAAKPMDDKNLEEIMTFVKGKVGVISPQANEKIHELLHKHGMFKFMMGLANAANGFQVDLGLIFAKEVEKQMGDSL